MRFNRHPTILCLWLLFSLNVRAAPTETQFQHHQADGSPGTIGSAPDKNATDPYGSMFNHLIGLKPTATPTSMAQVTSILSEIFASKPTSLYESAEKLILNGIVPEDIANFPQGFSSGCNSNENVNLKPPSHTIYPRNGIRDAPYSNPEGNLRAAIHIPSTFTYGKKPPVILAPGTGLTGCITFSGNFIKLFDLSHVADPVWLNIPNYLLDDVQSNAEYLAYAVNYVSSISQHNVSVVAWSQANIDTQWALKYWPSTRSVVTDFISISADFHGTVESSIVCLSLPRLTCTPAIAQQDYNSQLIQRLRLNGGDSAYVPTTSIYSSADEVVQPQSGKGASAFIKDARLVGVTNVQVQEACPGLPAGGLYLHEGVLYNPIAYALAIDALTHPGPGMLDRLDLINICAQALPPSLNVSDVLTTEGSLIIALLAVLLYQPKANVEPVIKPYAFY